MNLCKNIKTALENGYNCQDNGSSASVLTHCLYPSFTPVSVTVTKTRNGFLISDDGKAYANAWDHGRNKKLICRELAIQASRYHLNNREVEMYVEVPSAEWLYSAIIAVANGSAAAAANVVNKAIAAAEVALKSRIGSALQHKNFSFFEVSSDVDIKGSSGKHYQIDFTISNPNQMNMLLIDAVSSHHNSITHKFTAFSDILSGGHLRSNNMAVFDKKLEIDDSKLMQQVADLVPYSSFESGALSVLKL